MATLGIEPTTAESNEFPVQAPAFNITKVTTVLTGIFGSVATALFTAFGIDDPEKAPSAVVFGVAAVLVSIIFSIAIVVAADVRARAQATAAKAPADEDDDSSTGSHAKGLNSIGSIGDVVGATVRNEGNDRFVVLAVRSNEKDTEVLVARIGGTLEWKSMGDLTNIAYPY